MFLETTIRRNPQLVACAQHLHHTGQIQPDTYVIDLDAVEANAKVIAETAARHAVTPWFVIKQFGRNPIVAKTIAKYIPKAAAIDVREADLLIAAGIPLGNVGHLVQIPLRSLPRILASRPDFVTVFDLANLTAVAAAASSLGFTQPVLLRIAGDPQVTYPGQGGGFSLTAIPKALAAAESLPGVQVAGVTGFPCVIYDEKLRQPVLTATAERVLEAAELLRAHGISDPVVSLPSHSSCSTIPMVADAGGTHIEPGHALTGSTPEHATRDDLPERPAMVYVSEVLQVTPQPMIAGGGFYGRGHTRQALLGVGTDTQLVPVLPDPPENIDYYRRLDVDSTDELISLGQTALLAFRTQVFVTRSQVAVVEGLAHGSGEVIGIFDAAGAAVPYV